MNNIHTVTFFKFKNALKLVADALSTSTAIDEDVPSTGIAQNEDAPSSSASTYEAVLLETISISLGEEMDSSVLFPIDKGVQTHPVNKIYLSILLKHKLL